MRARHRTSRLAGVVGGCAVAAALAQSAYANQPVPEGGSTTPAVNMERVLLAAQLDPGRTGTGTTRGAKGSVLRVERALHRKHLLAKRWVDGSFGSRTKAAYSNWQRRLGYSGLGANGLPGETSLRKLGAGHFHVTRVVTPGPHLSVAGVVLNRRTNRMKKAAANRIRQHFSCKISVVQGSYNAGGVGASAGTHDGGGAMDVSVNRGCGVHHRATVRALREVGFAAWYRPTLPGVWTQHIHAIAVSDPDLAGAAQDQVVDYYHGRDGLAGNGPDNGPKVKKITWEQYRRTH